MARAVGKLSSLDVARSKKRGYYGDGGGLYLLVGPNGAKSWVFRFRKEGKLREMGLSGPLQAILAALARHLRYASQGPAIAEPGCWFYPL